MELDLEVLNNKKFKNANSDYIDGMPCVYIGKTIHHPRCRQSMHNNCKVGDWEGESWTCYCTKKTGDNLCKLSTRSSSKVGKYMTGFLMAHLFKDINPQRGSKENSQAEKDLTKHLRTLGFGVWAGHLDSKKSD